MTEYPYLNITYRDGKFFAAYLYLAAPKGEGRLKTKRLSSSVMLDFDEAGNAVGVEILSKTGFDAGDLNKLLVPFGVRPIEPKELAPLTAA